MEKKLPLHDAVRYGDLAEVRKLAEKKANLLVRDEDEQTPLHYVFSPIYREAAEILLAAGAELEALDQWSFTPLLTALKGGYVDAAKYLMEKGADFKFVNEFCRNAFFCLAQGLPQYCLAKEIEVSITDGQAREITFYFRDDSYNKLIFEEKDAAGERREDQVADPAEQARMLRDLLPEKARKDDLMELARLFLSAGVRADAVCTDYGTTVVIRAADTNAPVEFIALMAEHGADVRAKDKWGLTALHYAARKGHADIAAYLLEAGADVNAADEIGFTPLHEAAENNQLEIAKQLLGKGADKKAALRSDYGSNKAGFTPRDVAEAGGNEEMAKLLR